MCLIIASMALIAVGLILGLMGTWLTPLGVAEDNGDGTLSVLEVTAVGMGAKKAQKAQRLTSLGLVFTSLGGVLSLIPSLLTAT